MSSHRVGEIVVIAMIDVNTHLKVLCNECMSRVYLDSFVYTAFNTPTVTKRHKA